MDCDVKFLVRSMELSSAAGLAAATVDLPMSLVSVTAAKACRLRAAEEPELQRVLGLGLETMEWRDQEQVPAAASHRDRHVGRQETVVVAVAAGYPTLLW